MDVSLLVTLLQQKVKDYFKPKYHVNNNEVVTNSEIGYVFKLKNNKTVIPNVEIHLAETIAGRWVYANSVHFHHQGYGWAVNTHDIDEAFPTREIAIQEAMREVIRHLHRATELHSDAKTIIQTLTTYLNKK